MSNASQRRTASELQHKIVVPPGITIDTSREDPRIRRVREVFRGLPAGRKVLDVGCYDGAVLGPFAKDHQLHGVDISPQGVAQANERGWHAVVHDLEAGPLPYPNKAFDVVFTGETIEHLMDTDWFLSEINRVLLPGGRLILSFPNVRTFTSLVMMAFLDLPPKFAARYRSPHFRDFTMRLIRMALANHQFEIERAMGCQFSLGPKEPVCEALARWFPSWADQVLVVAAKRADSRYDPDQAIQPFLFSHSTLATGGSG